MVNNKISRVSIAQKYFAQQKYKNIRDMVRDYSTTTAVP
jgi:hypothetical protein